MSQFLVWRLLHQSSLLLTPLPPFSLQHTFFYRLSVHLFDSSCLFGTAASCSRRSHLPSHETRPSFATLASSTRSLKEIKIKIKSQAICLPRSLLPSSQALLSRHTPRSQPAHQRMWTNGMIALPPPRRTRPDREVLARRTSLV